MVFFTAILIVVILYFMQTQGLIYVVILALVGEFINIFLTHTMTKAVEKKFTLKLRNSTQAFTKEIKTHKKTIAELEKLQDEAAAKIYNANGRIKELEELLENQAPPQTPAQPQNQGATPPPKKEAPKPSTGTSRPADHLPDGSNRKRPRI